MLGLSKRSVSAPGRLWHQSRERIDGADVGMATSSSCCREALIWEPRSPRSLVVLRFGRGYAWIDRRGGSCLAWWR